MLMLNILEDKKLYCQVLFIQQKLLLFNDRMYTKSAARAVDLDEERTRGSGSAKTNPPYSQILRHNKTVLYHYPPSISIYR